MWCWTTLLLGCTTDPSERAKHKHTPMSPVDSAAPTEPVESTRPVVDLVLPLDPAPSLPLICGAPEGWSLAWQRNGLPFADAAEVGPGVTRGGELWTCIATRGAETASRSVEIVAPGGNILVLLLDDIGVDKVGGYGEHPQPSATPTLDGLIEDGMLFRNAYAYPSCSPTRAAMLTGRHGRRTGVGNGINFDTDDYALPLTEITLPEMLNHSEYLVYDNALLGKWHLTSRAQADHATHPNLQGFQWYEGSLSNLDMASTLDGTLDYFRWEKVTNGHAEEMSTYATTDSVDDAIARIDQLSEPFFLQVSFNAAHVPLTPPPGDLTSVSVTKESPTEDLVDAIAEALDAELGRLLGAIDPSLLNRTTLVVMSDNGTARHAIREPWDRERCKLTLFDGGVRVPLVVTGPLVTEPGSESDALVHAMDIFALAGDIAGVPWDGLNTEDGEPIRVDAVSLLPYLHDPALASLRDTLYIAKFAPNGAGPYSAYDQYGVRDAEHKYVNRGGTESLFAFVPGAQDEGPDLLLAGETSLDPTQTAALNRLRVAATDTRDSLSFGP
jgi:arylsulfatase B